MLSYLFSIIQLFHSILIIYISFLLYEVRKSIPFKLVIFQITFTILIQLISTKFQQKNYKQIFFSFSLIYAIRITKLDFLKYLFLLKIFYLQKSLTNVSQLILNSKYKIIRLIKIAFNYLKITAVFYLALGISIVIYKYWVYIWDDFNNLNDSTHQIFYFFIISASSIGYGDLTPRNQQQIQFLLIFIPIMIISFGIYFGKTIKLFQQFITTIIEDSSNQQNNNNKKSIQIIWGKQQCKSFQFYITECQIRNQLIQERNKNLAYNPISIAYQNSKKTEPLVKRLLGQSYTNQHKIMLSSYITKCFFPQNWTIINKGNIDQNIYLIQEGIVQVGNIKLKPGTIFNQIFYGKNTSNQNYKALTFVTVWKINIHDIDQLCKHSINLSKIINNNIFKN